MECSDPGALRDEDIIAYLAGEPVRPAVIQHLTRCQSCLAQLATYQRIERKLTSALYRWDCPPNQVLGEYQLGFLSTTEAAAVKDHLRLCVLCAAEVRVLANYLSHDPLLMEQASLAQASVAVQAPVSNHHHPVQDLQQLMGQLHDQALAGARRIIATLLPPPEPRLGLQRDITAQVTQAAQWPRRYAAEDLSISLSVEEKPIHTHSSAHNGSLQLLGLVMQKGMPLEALQGIRVQLSAPGREIPDQTIDDLGNFVFSALMPAHYTLEIYAPAGVVVIDQIPVAAQ